MYEFIKDIVLMIILVSIFLVITRTQELIIAILLYLVIINILDGKAKEILSKLSIVHIIVAILFGFTRFIVLLDQVQIISPQFYYSIPTFIFALPAVLSFLVILLMIISYLIIEPRWTINKLFLLALVLPIISTVYYIVESFIINEIYNYMLNLNSIDSFSVGRITLSSVTFITTIQIIILVYLLMKSKETKIS